MAEQRSRRRRRRRGRGRGSAGEATPADATSAEGSPSASPEGRGRRAPPDWRWLSFPVFTGFVAGGLLLLIIAPEPNTLLYTVLFFGFLGATAFSLAHIFTRKVIDPRRR
ncbi:MAG: hypothetical protein IIC89_04240 [Chloroflexi bacterium]|nr:hypothetical protein [Chloroflexota bacterium]